MNCPKCGGKTCVIDTRQTEKDVRRRRECCQCKHKFTTYEILAHECEEGREAVNIMNKMAEFSEWMKRRKYEI